MNELSLKDKQAVIFGAGGSVGSAVAQALAAHGAAVYLSGRRRANLQQTAAAIRQAGGSAPAVELDAADEAAVAEYLAAVLQTSGQLDIVVNAMGLEPPAYGSSTSALELSLEQFRLPLDTLVTSQFITARAAARYMVRQHSGVILFITAIPARGLPNSAAIGSAFGAVESLLRCLAAELGPQGVRVVGIRSGAMVDSHTIQATVERTARQLAVAPAQVVAQYEQRTLLKRLATVADTAGLAAFLASDAARMLTGAIVNASGGAVMD